MFRLVRVTALWARPYRISTDEFSIHTSSVLTGTAARLQLLAVDQSLGPALAVGVATAPDAVSAREEIYVR